MKVIKKLVKTVFMGNIWAPTVNSRLFDECCTTLKVIVGKIIISHSYALADPGGWGAAAPRQHDISIGLLLQLALNYP
jgi:hypothetical protein